MKNVLEILKTLGIEVPEEKESELNKAISENYKTVAEVEKKISKIEAERDREKERADSAEETLKGFEGKDFDAISKERDEWKAKAEQAKADYEAKESARAYSEAVENVCKELKFSSNSAKKAFVSELQNENLKIKDGTLLGFNDFVEAYKKNDESAFVSEAEESKAVFTGPQGAQPPKADLHEADLRKAFGLNPKEK